MQVYFTPEQEAQTLQAARANGTDAERLVKDAALQFVDDANFAPLFWKPKATPTVGVHRIGRDGRAV